jgi:putative restriction endonuclease
MNRPANWSREEHILAFNLYSQIPFGTIHTYNPQIQRLAKLLGRSVGSISYKLANFARLDPALQARGIRGATHGAKGEEEIWQEFADDAESLAFESQRLMAQRLGEEVTDYAEVDTRDLPKAGLEREAIVRLRVNQSFFRRRVLSAYDNRCCITGLAVPALLTASHIVPWATDASIRLNPRNGLCLNTLHDRAFDRGLLWIDRDFVIHISPDLRDGRMGEFGDATWFYKFNGQTLRLPKKFTPDPELLQRHAFHATLNSTRND